MLVIVTVSVALTATCIFVPAVNVNVFPFDIVCDVDPSVILKLFIVPVPSAPSDPSAPAAPVAPVAPCGMPNANTPVDVL